MVVLLAFLIVLLSFGLGSRCMLCGWLLRSSSSCGSSGLRSVEATALEGTVLSAGRYREVR
jgi:hypothetical protein